MGKNDKKRVFQVAREFNISNEALISFLTKLNFNIRNHMSLISDEMYEEVLNKFSKETEISDKDGDFKRKLKEKRIREEEKKIEAQRRYQEKVRASIMIMTEPRGRKVRTGVEAGELPPTKKIDVEEEVIIVEPKEVVEEPIIEPFEEETPTSEILEEEKEEDRILKEAEKAVLKLFAKDKKTKPKVVKEKDDDIEVKSDETIEPPTEEKSAKKDVEHELELKLIRKIEATKEKRKESSYYDVQKKTDRKKLKAKDRLTETKKLDEDLTEYKKKKKKKRPHFEEGEIRRITEYKKDKLRKKIKKRKKPQISEAEVEESIKQTLLLMEESGKVKKRKKKVKLDEGATVEDNVLRIHEFITVAELATEMDVEAGKVIKKCMELGTFVTINHRLDEASLLAVADEFGFDVEIIPEFGSEKFEEIEGMDDESLAEPRPPVVTIMGHVDHGKTSLLDYIRKSNITHSETGGITQHIGAYEVNVNGKSITFLDTPGHEAFAAMRARGAQVTDIVILVVAADDNVMPQTVEAIDHAKAAGVPIIIAINKIDKPNANPENIKKQLAEHDVLIETWGGKYQCVEISAKAGENIDKLLESIIVEAEILELKANPNRLAQGVVIESRLDKGKGVVASVLVQKGRLEIGDPFLSGQFSGRVRSLYNDQGIKIKTAGPSTPVQVLGFSGLPQAGDSFIVLESERDTKEISFKRRLIKREQDFRRIKHITLDEISRRIKEGQAKELSIILKVDVDGSLEAISDSLTKLSNNEVAVKIIHKGVGAISESDVLLASASEAVILGFQVRPTLKAREIAQAEKVDIRLYKVIYDIISNIKDALEGLLEPEFEEKNMSVCEIRQVFRVPKIGVVAGCYVISGKVTRNDRAKLFREDKLIYDGKINSVKRFKEDVKEVVNGFECGIGLEGFDDIKVNDIVETYKIEEIKRTLSSVK